MLGAEHGAEQELPAMYVVQRSLYVVELLPYGAPAVLRPCPLTLALAHSTLGAPTPPSSTPPVPVTHSHHLRPCSSKPLPSHGSLCPKQMLLAYIASRSPLLRTPPTSFGSGSAGLLCLAILLLTCYIVCQKTCLELIVSADTSPPCFSPM